MLKIGDLNIKDVYIGTSSIQKAYLGTSLVYQKAPESPLVASYRCYDKTNEDEDRAILKDLTGNGHDITLNNFAFGGMSGYNGYIWNFNSFRRNKWEHTDSKIILDYNNIPELDSTVFEDYAKAEGTQIIKRTKIKVSGIKNGGQFVLYSAVNTTDVGLYPTLRNQVLIKEDGIYELKDLIIPTEYQGHLGDFYYGLKEIAIQEGELITIEQIPQYPKALVSDGIDDYGICTNMPTFPKETGYTIIAIRKWLDVSKESYFVGKTLPNEGAFIFEGVSSNGNANTYSYYQSSGIITLPPLLSYQTSTNYNGKTIVPGNVGDSGTNLNIFNIRGEDSRKAKMALWALDIYNRDLTDEEIEEAKAKMIAEYEEKTGDLSLSLVAAWSAKGKTNDDEDRAILKDLTGNGHDITLNNFAFSGMSGYGGYSTDFNNWTYDSKNLVAQYTTNQVTLKPSETETVTWLNFRKNILDKITLKLRVNRDIKIVIRLDTIENVSTSERIILYSNEDNIINLDEVDTSQYKNRYLFFESDTFEDIIIEQIPEYPDALVFDGIVDYGNGNIPMLNDYTIICKRMIRNGGTVLSNANTVNNNDGAFIFEASQKRTMSFGEVNYIEYYNNVISFQTKTKYNNKEIISGNSESFSNLMLGTYASDAFHNGTSDVVFYSAYLFNRSLTDQEIKKFIRENIDPQYLLPSEIPTPDVYYDFSTGSNDDENRETIVDQSGNGNDATAYNFAWSGMSGYGGYNTSMFNKWRNLNSFATVEDSTTVKIPKDLNNAWRFQWNIKEQIQTPISFKVICDKACKCFIEYKSNVSVGSSETTYKCIIVQISANVETIITVPVSPDAPEGQVYSRTIVWFNTSMLEDNDVLTVKLIPEYPGALCFDGTDDYLQMDFPTGYKTVLLKVINFNNFGNAGTIYDQRNMDGNGKFSIETLANTSVANSGTTKVNNIATTERLPTGETIFIEASNNIADSEIKQTGTIFGRNGFNTTMFIKMALYKFLGFKDKLTEEQIYNVIQKYNLLEGVDDIQ